MSDFKDSIIKATVENVDFEKEIAADFERCARAVVNETIDDMYQKIKDMILHKSETAQYETIGHTRYISGYIELQTSESWEWFGETKSRFLEGLSKSDISKRYLSNHSDILFFKPDIHENAYYRFYCAFLNYKKHHRRFGNPAFYNSYHLTDVAKTIIEGINRVATKDDIAVSFSHISLAEVREKGILKTPIIPDGGNDKKLKVERPSGKVVLKYSITF